VSAAQNDAWYIACRTHHIAAVATLSLPELGGFIPEFLWEEGGGY